MATAAGTIDVRGVFRGIPKLEEQRFDTFDLELQVSGESKLDEGEFEGLAVSFDSEIDAFIPTFIKPGAFRKTLRENGDRIRILWAHRRDLMIGFPTELKETKDGVFIRGRLVDEGKGAEALALLRLAQDVGSRVEMSIGVEMIRFEIERNPKTQEAIKRVVSEAKINEVSLVFMGADPRAGVVEVNQEGGALQDQLVSLKASIDSLVAALQKDGDDSSSASESQTADAGDGKATSAETDAGDDLSTSAEGNEDFAGRVLSKKNIARVQEIIKSLQGLLPSGDDDDDEKNRHQSSKKSKKDEKQDADEPDRIALFNEAALKHMETSKKVQEVLQ